MALALILLPFAPAVGAASVAGWSTPGASWTNGVVLCRFSASSPGVDVSALARPDSGLAGLLGTIAERSPGGTVVGTTQGAPLTWTVENASGGAGYDEGYTAHASLVAAGGVDARNGSVDVRVDFDLGEESPSGGAPSNEVTLSVLLSNWSRVAPGDSLGFDLSLWPSHPSAEHLSGGSTSDPTVASRSNVNEGILESWIPSSTAEVGWDNGTRTTVDTTSSMRVTPSNATIGIMIASSSPEVLSLAYSGYFAVTIPPVPASLPLIDYVLVVGAGAGLSAAVAYGARWIRKRPSDLVFDTEEE